MADGLRKGLTSYGDAGFSLFLRKAFIKAAGYSDDALNRPIVGITNTHSDYNPCHGNVPALIEAAKRGVMRPSQSSATVDSRSGTMPSLAQQNAAVTALPPNDTA